MAPLALLIHLLGFVAPALVLAVLVAGAARVLWPRRAAARWGRSVVLNAVVGVAVLAGGLVLFGQDGKMVTYAALVAAVATSQWLASRGWRG